MCQIEFQLLIIVTNHSLQMDNADRSKVRKRKDRKNCKARAKYRLMQKAKAMREENLKTYNSWLLPDKLAFAMNNYRFPNYPDVPAIEVFESTIRMSEGMSRGIKVGEALPYLPKNFILALAWHSIVDTPSSDPIQSCYQVKLPHKRILLLETSVVPDHTYGLGNLVNAAISHTNRNSAEYQSAVHEITDQNLGDAQCIFAYPKNRNLKNLHPSYVKVVRDVPRGHELLMPRGYGDRAYRFPS